uniref:Uncharacterized protein n=1 Tax=Opuntia streptacantha TaxID=393608 RepID=A0A7C9AXP6_OPUST
MGRVMKVTFWLELMEYGQRSEETCLGIRKLFTPDTLATQELQISSLQILRLLGTEYSWGTSSTLFHQMWVEARCSGTHFTTNRLVVLMGQMVKNKGCLKYLWDGVTMWLT